ncbi:pyrrolo-quinoline quinone [Sphingomonas gilva]|uniref:Pyrrolo-quinoline quinone n=1 Tax=Sphingomonas gilva TaxID=2305907 RepID=A0A396S3V1_9SPHN|nr:PQQ-like beta-propeller repeat protein [Sphingomonas gilva]RHW18085.1 pyrrolo-quinoline quinone [Sphingomonas gilva]
MIIKMRSAVAIAALVALSGCGIFGGGKPKTPVLGERVPILLSEDAAEVDPSIADVQVLLPSPEVNAAWGQPGGNAAKSMGHLALAASPTRAWTAQIDGGSNRARLAAAPVVAGGRLYVVDVAGVVHAFAADTGARVWSRSTSDDSDNSAALFGGGVSVEGDRLYATNGLGDVIAMNAADGAQIWKVKPGGTSPLRGAPTIFGGQVYVMSQDNQLIALNAADGAVVWTASGALEASGVFGVAAPAAAAGTIVAGFSSGELSAYRYENGRVVWQDTLSRTSISTSVSSLADIDADAVIDQGRVFAIGQGGRMVSVELTSGQRIWEQSIAGISTPWIAGEWLFVVTDEGRLLCLARSNGKVRWATQLARWRDEEDKKGPISWLGPVLAGGRLALVNSEGQIAYVSPETGQVAATVPTEDNFSLPPLVANSTLYLLGDSGRISAYR